MPTRTTTRLAAAGVTAALLLAGAGVAVAGHANPVLEARLDGRQEVGDGENRRIVGDPDGRGEGYVFSIDDDVSLDGSTTDNGDTLCYLLLVDRIADLEQGPQAGVRMAHIHEGAAGENGPVVANLAWPQGGQAADCLSADEVGKFGGGADVEANQAIIDDILEHPEDYYFNVHNGEYPGGAIRGQLSGR